MKKNVGSTDRLVRILLALVITIMYAGGALRGWWAVLGGFLVFMLLTTSSRRHCPLYVPFRISTYKDPKDIEIEVLED